MNIKTSTGPGDTRIEFSGQFTFTDHLAFKEHVIAKIDAARETGVVIDLAGLEYIDSAGLGMLLLAREAAQRQDRTITLAGARDHVARMLAVSKFAQLFTLAP